MSKMFAFRSNISNLDVSKWDVSKVINMSEMYAGCKSLSNLDVSKRIQEVQQAENAYD